MTDVLNRLMSQLDSLLPFLALAHREVFEVIGDRYSAWLSEDQQATLPRTFEQFERQIAHGAFLLGYSYGEAFFSDLVRSIYLNRPQMLPKNKELKFQDVLEQGAYENILAHMINKEVLSVFHGSLEQIGRYFRDRLRLPWPADESKLVLASRLRNCCLHNMGRADRRLAEVSRYSEGQEISLKPDDVHRFGLVIREVAPTLFEEASRRYINR